MNEYEEYLIRDEKVLKAEEEARKNKSWTEFLNELILEQNEMR